MCICSESGRDESSWEELEELAGWSEARHCLLRGQKSLGLRR